MSVESEILRIQRNVANAYAAVAEKGGKVPLQPNSANLAAAVGSIPQALPPLDNNPIGTIIGYMGLAAPDHYLICDGAEYNIADYPSLAAHFAAQFGTANHFGGDGTTTFAVPDMRNLFIRGYCGEAEERLSGEIGVRQEATSHVNVFSSSGGLSGYISDTLSENFDKKIGVRTTAVKTGTSTGTAASDTTFYTSRPINMAVLYCIKATESYSVQNVYSTEETRIGTWIDGKPLYRKCYFHQTTTIASGENVFLQIPTGFECKHFSATITRSSGDSFQNSIFLSDANWSCSIYLQQGFLKIYSGSSMAPTISNRPAITILEYTKTTD